MELELHELKFHANIYIYIYIFKFDRPILDFLPIKFFDWNSILIKSSFVTGARIYIVSKQEYIAKYF